MLCEIRRNFILAISRAHNIAGSYIRLTKAGGVKERQTETAEIYE